MTALPVLQLFRPLEAAPVSQLSGSPPIRTFRVETDVPLWIALRQRAFAKESPPGRAWTATDFQREILDQPWFDPQRIWVAEDRDSPCRLVGAIATALRGRDDAQRPAIHWLMVDPDGRGCGLASRLVTTLEAAAWRDGYREVVLETHTGWRAAVSLYRKLGYRQRTSSW